MTSIVQFKIFYGDNFERCKMHRMKKERFELITYQEFTCETKWHHAISVLQTAESQKCYHVTKIFEPQTKTNVREAGRKKVLVHGRLRPGSDAAALMCRT